MPFHPVDWTLEAEFPRLPSNYSKIGKENQQEEDISLRKIVFLLGEITVKTLVRPLFYPAGTGCPEECELSG